MITDSLDRAASELLRELQAQDATNVQIVSAADVGTADNVVLDPTVQVLQWSPSLLLLVDVAFPNTTPVPSLGLRGLPTIPITSANGNILATGVLAGKCMIGISSVGGGFVARLLISPVVSGFRSNQELWVRADGNDSNDGSANTPSSAKRSIQSAAMLGSNNFGFASTNLTIRLGQPVDPGDIANAYVLPSIPALPGEFAIVGDITRPAYYPLVEDPQDTGPMAIFSAQSARISGVEIKNPGTGVPGIVASAGCHLTVDNTILSNRGSGVSGAYLQANPGSVINIGDGLRLGGRCDSAFYVNGGSFGAGKEPGSQPTLITLLDGFYARTMFNMAPRAQSDLLGALQWAGTNAGAQWIVSIFAFLDTNGRTGAFVPGNPGLNYVDGDGRVR